MPQSSRIRLCAKRFDARHRRADCGGHRGPKPAGQPARRGPEAVRAGIAAGPILGVRSAAGWGHHPLAGKPGRAMVPQPHRTEAQESSVCSNHTAATRSLRPASEARPPLRLLGSRPRDPRPTRSARRSGIRERSVAVDGHAGVGIVRPGGHGARRPTAARASRPAWATRSTLRRARCRGRTDFPPRRYPPTRCC